MQRDHLSVSNPNSFFGCHPTEFCSHVKGEAFFEDLGSALPTKCVRPIIQAQQPSYRQQVLERILENISRHDLVGKSYVEQYMRHKYRRNCKPNTLRQAATSLVQFLTCLRNSGKMQPEQLSREDIEAFVEVMQDRGLKPATVCTRLRNVYAFIRFLIEHKW